MRFHPLCFDYHWDAITTTTPRTDDDDDHHQAMIWILPCTSNDDDDDENQNESVMEATAAAAAVLHYDDVDVERVNDELEVDDDDVRMKPSSLSDLVDHDQECAQSQIEEEPAVTPPDCRNDTVMNEVDGDMVETATACDTTGNTGLGDTEKLVDDQTPRTADHDTTASSDDLTEDDEILTVSGEFGSLVPTSPSLLPFALSPSTNWQQLFLESKAMMTSIIMIPSIPASWARQVMPRRGQPFCHSSQSSSTLETIVPSTRMTMRTTPLRNASNESFPSSRSPLFAQRQTKSVTERSMVVYDGANATEGPPAANCRDMDLEIRQAFWLGLLIGMLGATGHQQRQSKQLNDKPLYQQRSTVPTPKDGNHRLDEHALDLSQTQRPPVNQRHDKNGFHETLDDSRACSKPSAAQHQHVLVEAAAPFRLATPQALGQEEEADDTSFFYTDDLFDCNPTCALPETTANPQQYDPPLMASPSRLSFLYGTKPSPEEVGVHVPKATTNDIEHRDPEPAEMEYTDRHKKKKKRHKTESHTARKRSLNKEKESSAKRDEPKLIDENANKKELIVHLREPTMEATVKIGPAPRSSGTDPGRALEQQSRLWQRTPSSFVAAARERTRASTNSLTAGRAVPTKSTNINQGRHRTCLPNHHIPTNETNVEPPAAKTGLRFPPGFLGTDDNNKNTPQLNNDKEPYFASRLVDPTRIPFPPQENQAPAESSRSHDRAHPVDLALKPHSSKEAHKETHEKKHRKKDKKKKRSKMESEKDKDGVKRRKVVPMDVADPTGVHVVDSKRQDLSDTQARLCTQAWASNPITEKPDEIRRLGIEFQKDGDDGAPISLRSTPAANPHRATEDFRAAKSTTLRSSSADPVPIFRNAHTQPTTRTLSNHQHTSLPVSAIAHGPALQNMSSPGFHGLAAFKLLCSEFFLETSSEVVAELASGRWTSSLFAQTNTTESGVLSDPATRLGRSFEFYDSVLVDRCDVDIELCGRRGIVVSYLDSWEGTEEPKILTRRLVQLASVGRYKTLEIILCAGRAVSASTAMHVTQLQNALLRYGDSPPTCCVTRFVSPHSLSATIAHCALCSDGSSYRAISGLYDVVRDEFAIERIRFLLGIVPTLTVGGAIQLLKQNSRSPSVALMGKTGQAFHCLLTNASFGSKRKSYGDDHELHPAAMQQLSYVLNAVVSQTANMA